MTRGIKHGSSQARQGLARLSPLALCATAALCPDKSHAQDSETGTDAIVVTLAYTGETNAVLAGGAARATRYLDNLDIQLAADLEELAGWQGARLYAYGLYNNGVAFSPAVGDAFVTSNIETGQRALRLYEFWLEQDLGSAASLKVGLYDLNSEFDALDSAGLFVNSAHGIGVDISQSGQNGPSIFPSTALAARLGIELGGGWRARVAVLDGVPGDPAHPARTTVRLGNGDGALLIGEIEAGFDGGKILAGHWRYTAAFDQHDGGISRNNHGFYLRGESRLVSAADGSDRGLTGFFRLGMANGRINEFGGFASLGLVYRGPLPSRPDDQVGLALASAFTSAAHRDASGAGRSEANVELTYRAALAPWLSVQPGVQYVINPGPYAANDNALVAALRAEIAWEF